MRAPKPCLAFISYRRLDSSVAARWLAETIQDTFGSTRVFIDTDAIRVGDDWPKRIDQALSSASALIVVIGPAWLRSADEFGRRRLDIETDWVRQEVAYAIEKELFILPLLVSRAALPAREALPTCLQALLDHQALELRDDRWLSDRDRVLTALEHTGFKRDQIQPYTRSNTSLPDALSARPSPIFDQQVKTLKTALALVYRARNTARDLRTTPEQIDRSGGRERLEKLLSYQASVEDLLFEERALLPDLLFRQLHALKHELAGFSIAIGKWRRARRKRSDPPNHQDLAVVGESYDRLDRSYENLVQLVQSFIGVTGADAE